MSSRIVLQKVQTDFLKIASVLAYLPHFANVLSRWDCPKAMSVSSKVLFLFDIRKFTSTFFEKHHYPIALVVSPQPSGRPLSIPLSITQDIRNIYVGYTQDNRVVNLRIPYLPPIFYVLLSRYLSRNHLVTIPIPLCCHCITIQYFPRTILPVKCSATVRRVIFFYCLDFQSSILFFLCPLAPNHIRVIPTFQL